MQTGKVKHSSLLPVNNSPQILFQCLLIHITPSVLGIHSNRYAETNHAVNCTILSLFTVYYATAAYNQAVNIADIAVKNNLNYCCQKQAAPHHENCGGAKSEVDSETSSLANGTILSKRESKSPMEEHSQAHL